MDLTVRGEHIEKAITDIVKRLDGFKYKEALAVLERVSYQLKDNATINISPKIDKSPVDHSINEWNENTVMGITSKAFGAAVGVMHDLTGHFQGDRYTVAIDVEPDGVMVRKIPKD